MSLPSLISNQKLSDQATTLVIARAFNTLVSNLQQIFTSLTNRVQLDSCLLPNVSLNGGGHPTSVPHTLGRQLSGWQIVRLRSPAVVYEQSASDTYLTLISDQPVSIDLLVF